MSLDDIDIGSWGKKEEKMEEKKSKPPRKTTPRKKKSTSRTRTTSSRTKQRDKWDLKPKKQIPIEKVPIDALRGVYYYCYNRVDKKMSKVELKRILEPLLQDKKIQEKIIQTIVNIIFS